MSLRLRISLFIGGSTVLILLLALVLIVNNARYAVSDEMDSTAQLTLDLLETVLTGLPNDSEHYQTIVHHLKNMEKRRHLIIYLSDKQKDLVHHPADYTALAVPVWFSYLVAPAPKIFRRTLSSNPANESPTDIILQTDPSDEIEEAWQESSTLLILIVLFALGLIVLLYIGLGIALRPLTQLQQAINAIGHRQYQTRLPVFQLVEFNHLAQRFNDMAQQLQQFHQENQRLLQYSLTLQEEERRIIARELHDELGQCLTAIKTDAYLIIADSTQTNVRESARAITETTQHVYGVVKEMIRRLRPAALDELGLIPALQQTLQDWQNRYPNTEVIFNVIGESSQLEISHCIHLYRIVQEALTNTAKYANASHLNIELRIETTGIQLTIADDGKGFNPHNTVGGFGLLGIRERAEALNGTFDLISQQGAGCRLIIRI